MDVDISRRLFVLIILQFLRDENFLATAHVLEQESGLFFDMDYFSSLVVEGKLDEAEHYFSGFSHVHENYQSTKIYFELRKQKFLEALDKKDRVKALDIIRKEFRDFNQYEHNLIGDAMSLLTMDDFRKHGRLQHYGPVQVERICVVGVLRRLLTSYFAGKGDRVFVITSQTAEVMRNHCSEEMAAVVRRIHGLP